MVGVWLFIAGALGSLLACKEVLTILGSYLRDEPMREPSLGPEVVRRACDTGYDEMACQHEEREQHE